MTGDAIVMLEIRYSDQSAHTTWHYGLCLSDTVVSIKSRKMDNMAIGFPSCNNG